MQVHSVKPRLKAPGCERLKLKYDDLLSNVALNFMLRHYNEKTPLHRAVESMSREGTRMLGRGSHSFTSQLNLIDLYGVGGARRGCVAHAKGVLGGAQGV